MSRLGFTRLSAKVVLGSIPSFGILGGIIMRLVNTVTSGRQALSGVSVGVRPLPIAFQGADKVNGGDTPGRRESVSKPLRFGGMDLGNLAITVAATFTALGFAGAAVSGALRRQGRTDYTRIHQVDPHKDKIETGKPPEQK
jgi:hypothetical protein